MFEWPVFHIKGIPPFFLISSNKTFEHLTSPIIFELGKSSKIDFASIDLEGQEYEVLREFNFKRYKINLLSVEMLSHNALSKKNCENINRLLIRNNFKIVYKTGVNYFYKNTKWRY